jgi:hypothetical protein
MHSDTWYDLAVRELAEMTDPGKEKLAELEGTVGTLGLRCLSEQDEDGEALDELEAVPLQAPPAQSADPRSTPRAA